MHSSVYLKVIHFHIFLGIRFREETCNRSTRTEQRQATNHERRTGYIVIVPRRKVLSEEPSPLESGGAGFQTLFVDQMGERRKTFRKRK